MQCGGRPRTTTPGYPMVNFREEMLRISNMDEYIGYWLIAYSHHIYTQISYSHHGKITHNESWRTLHKSHPEWRSSYRSSYSNNYVVNVYCFVVGGLRPPNPPFFWGALPPRPPARSLLSSSRRGARTSSGTCLPLRWRKCKFFLQNGIYLTQF